MNKQFHVNGRRNVFFLSFFSHPLIQLRRFHALYPLSKWYNVELRIAAVDFHY